MLTENEVVEKVVEYLKQQGYVIEQNLGTTEKGIDIIASKDGKTLCIEAKGGTSAQVNSKRFGLGFNKNQVKSHVSVAILASMKVLADGSNREVGIALPDDKLHRELIKLIHPSLKKLGIKIFWASKDQVLVSI